MARYEIEVLPWAIDDARETYLYLLKRDERLADEFQRRVTEALRALSENGAPLPGSRGLYQALSPEEVPSWHHVRAARGPSDRLRGGASEAATRLLEEALRAYAPHEVTARMGLRGSHHRAPTYETCRTPLLVALRTRAGMMIMTARSSSNAE